MQCAARQQSIFKRATINGINENNWNVGVDWLHTHCLIFIRFWIFFFRVFQMNILCRHQDNDRSKCICMIINSERRRKKHRENEAKKKKPPIYWFYYSFSFGFDGSAFICSKSLRRFKDHFNCSIPCKFVIGKNWIRTRWTFYRSAEVGTQNCFFINYKQ